MTTPEPRDLSNHYLWFDTEYTSLELDEAKLLQVALVITDANLQRIAPAAQDLRLLVRLPEGERCSPWVEEHLKGLLTQCRSEAALPVADVNTALAQHLEALLGPNPPSVKLRPPLAGNSIQADWFLARKFLPAIMARAHYRVLDVSSWKVFWKNALGDFPFDKDNEPLVRQYFPGEFNSSAATHDAHFDVLASIAELNFYRTHQQINWPPKGQG
ncbi:MAG: exonuclease domain-containing protein [Verrucomicrobia bacterium]|nr:exonuclease domain-containing protein [Verrucomicrobiota bacterium]